MSGQSGLKWHEGLCSSIPSPDDMQADVAVWTVSKQHRQETEKSSPEPRHIVSYCYSFDGITPKDNYLDSFSRFNCIQIKACLLPRIMTASQK